MRQETIGFIGGGNMAEGIIKGVVADKAFAPENIHVYDILPQRMDLSLIHILSGNINPACPPC